MKEDKLKKNVTDKSIKEQVIMKINNTPMLKQLIDKQERKLEDVKGVWNMMKEWTINLKNFLSDVKKWVLPKNEWWQKTQQKQLIKNETKPIISQNKPINKWKSFDDDRTGSMTWAPSPSWSKWLDKDWVPIKK